MKTLFKKEYEYFTLICIDTNKTFFALQIGKTIEITYGKGYNMKIVSL